MIFIGTGQQIELADIVRAAQYLLCDVETVKAVLEVESPRGGFDVKNRPIILFEPHVFYARLGRVQRDAAVEQGVAYKKWKTKPYPRTQDARYDQLDKAVAIHQNAALESASWGMAQVMGFNYARCGFTTITSFVEAMKASEGQQLLAMCKYIRSARLDDELRRHDWTGFARGYNGPAFAQNRYDEKLAAAYKRLREIA